MPEKGTIRSFALHYMHLFDLGLSKKKTGYNLHIVKHKLLTKRFVLVPFIQQSQF